ncbi:hypothetical protein Tco_0110562 [Tanacetum coccineum]
MDPYVTSTPNSIKLPNLDTGKFEQWKFRIQQYLQHEHYASMGNHSPEKETSSQNMAFISSSNTNSGKSEVPTAQSFSTASGQVTTASTEVATATFSHDTICAYIATQQSGSQIKYETSQIDDD